MHRRELNIGRTTLSIETGRLARQAGGSAVVRYGDTVELVTACHAVSVREGIDFLPLTVDYREYTRRANRSQTWPRRSRKIKGAPPKAATLAC